MSRCHSSTRKDAPVSLVMAIICLPVAVLAACCGTSSPLASVASLCQA